jgi:50S ribosomal subunit-associated GTPase HflX
MFSHLKLTDLWLKGNICVNKSFVDPSPADIEEALQKCEENYDECPESDECLKALENRLAEKIDQNFELITGRIDEQNKENARKLKEIEKTTNEKFQKFEDKFELMVQLYYQLYEKNKDNSKHIREISQTVEKILEMLTPSKIQPISVVNKRWKTK